MRAQVRGISLDLKVPRRLPGIEADLDRLSQIIGNLISNSLKFTHSGGHVVVRAIAKNKSVELIVEDDGPGIDQADMEKVFEPFFQSAAGSQIRQGMGLGLTIVQQLVLAHGGSIRIMNLQGGGLRATVVLPRR